MLALLVNRRLAQELQHLALRFEPIVIQIDKHQQMLVHLEKCDRVHCDVCLKAGRKKDQFEDFFRDCFGPNCKAAPRRCDDCHPIDDYAQCSYGGCWKTLCLECQEEHDDLIDYCQDCEVVLCAEHKLVVRCPCGGQRCERCLAKHAKKCRLCREMDSKSTDQVRFCSFLQNIELKATSALPQLQVASFVRRAVNTALSLFGTSTIKVAEESSILSESDLDWVPAFVCVLQHLADQHEEILRAQLTLLQRIARNHDYNGIFVANCKTCLELRSIGLQLGFLDGTERLRSDYKPYRCEFCLSATCGACLKYCRYFRCFQYRWLCSACVDNHNCRARDLSPKRR